jgi:hypothetical protein
MLDHIEQHADRALLESCEHVESHVSVDQITINGDGVSGPLAVLQSPTAFDDPEYRMVTEAVRPLETFKVCFRHLALFWRHAAWQHGST